MADSPDTEETKSDTTKSLPLYRSKPYTKNGYWIFIYWPDEDHLMMLFRGLRRGFWPYGTTIFEAANDSLSEHGLKKMQEKDWQSYYIDTDLTKDWQEACAIAGGHFGTSYIPGQETVTDLQPSDQEANSGSSEAQEGPTTTSGGDKNE